MSNIHEEMIETSKVAFSLGHQFHGIARAIQDHADIVKELAAELTRLKAERDTIANSGALVPVPDGGPRELVELYGHQKFLLGDHGVCEMVNPGQYDRKVSVRILANGDIIESEKYTVVVQPVRLVPIAEWENSNE